MLNIFVEHGLMAYMYMYIHCTKMAKPIETCVLHYPMIQFLLISFITQGSFGGLNKSVRIRFSVNVRNLSCFDMQLLGGPGSAKGCIVNDLKAMFGFAFISAEDLILQKLPTKAAGCGAEPISGTHDLVELLKSNPEYLTLDWVMDILLEEIENYPNQPILVDLIPNLKFMMRVDGFIKNCDKEMEEFERKVNLKLPTTQ